MFKILKEKLVIETEQIKLEKSVEDLMLVSFLLLTGVAFILARQIPSPAGMFPQVTSGIAFISLVAIITNNIRESGENEKDVSIATDEIFLLFSSLIYGILGVLYGLVWFTPLFVLIYSKWTGWSWAQGIAFSIICTGIPLFFNEYLAVDLMKGVL